MRRAFAPSKTLQLFVFTPLISLACGGGSFDPDRDSKSDDAASICRVSAFSNGGATLEGLNQPLDLFNIDFADFGSEVRDQGKVASCASHSILAVLENELFNQRGIRVDLSERYMLYANYMATKNMGTDPEVIKQYPIILEEFGVLPEVLWPYEAIDQNSHRFAQDAAQNLGEAESEEPTIDEALADTKCSLERSEILQDELYLGRLPAGPQPVALPVFADVLEGATMMEYGDVSSGEIFDCFTSDPTMVGSAHRVSPQEFLSLCFAFTPQSYYSCDAATLGLRILDEESGDDIGPLCASIVETSGNVALAEHNFRKALLALTLHHSTLGQSSFVAVNSPSAGGSLPIWFRGLPEGGGHAVAIVGHLTAVELQDVAEQRIGLLGTGTFDALATALDRSLPVDAPGEPAEEILETDPPEELVRKRIATRLGKTVLAEGGLLFFRNSWGRESDGVEIGAQGYQSMTFSYFEERVSLNLAQQHPDLQAFFAVDGVAQGGCPAEQGSIFFPDASLFVNNEALLETLELRYQSILEQVCNSN